MYLLREGLMSIVDGTETAPAYSATQAIRDAFNSRKNMALVSLVLSISTNQLFIVGEPDNPVTVWNSLQNVFQANTWSNKLRLKKRLFNLKLTSEDNLQAHLKEFTKIFQELAVLDEAYDVELSTKEQFHSVSETSSPLYKAVITGDVRATALLVCKSDLRTKHKGLCAAVCDGNDAIVEILLQNGTLPLGDDGSLRTPIRHAIIKSKEGCLKLLLEACQKEGLTLADVLLKPDKSSETPLHCAAINPDGRYLNILMKHLKQGMLEPLDCNKRTPLHWAAFYGNHNIVSLLLKAKVNCFTQDNGGRTALHYAVLSPKHLHTLSNHPLHLNVENHSPANDVECINKLLKSSPSLLKWRDHQGVSALHLATIDDRSSEVLSSLLNSSSEVDIIDNNGMTPLHWAASRGNVMKVKELLRAGAKLDACDDRKATPLHYAAYNKHSKCVLLLSQLQATADEGNSSEALLWASAAKADEALSVMIRHGVKLLHHNKSNEYWCPALHNASAKGFTSTVSLLLHLCRLPNSADDNGCTPLHLAAYGCHASVAKLLLKRGATLTVRDKSGFYPIHYAAVAGHLYTTEKLLRAGKDVSLVDYQGRSCLHLAAIKGFVQILYLFIENKADVNRGDYKGNSPLHYAARKGHLGCVTALLEAGAHHSPLQKHTSLTPLDNAIASDRSDIANVLRESGAISGEEVRHEAATKIQRTWRKKKNISSDHSRISSSISIAKDAKGSVKDGASTNKVQFGPRLEVRATPISMMKNDAIVRSRSADHKSVTKHKPTRRVSSAFHRASLSHSSSQDIELPSMSDLGVELQESLQSYGENFKKNSRVEDPSVDLYETVTLSRAVHQPTNICVALMNSAPPSAKPPQSTPSPPKIDDTVPADEKVQIQSKMADEKIQKPSKMADENIQRPSKMADGKIQKPSKMADVVSTSLAERLRLNRVDGDTLTEAQRLKKIEDFKRKKKNLVIRIERRSPNYSYNLTK